MHSSVPFAMAVSSFQIVVKAGFVTSLLDVHVCLTGVEFYLRLHVRWVDFLHLATFHLGLVFGKMFIGIEDHLMPFIDENLASLDLPKQVRALVSSYISLFLLVTGSLPYFSVDIGLQRGQDAVSHRGHHRGGVQSRQVH